MNIVLSGGELGGQEIEWPENEKSLIINGLCYKISTDVAVYNGLEHDNIILSY